MAAYRRVYDSRHLQADCQEPGSAPEPYARKSSMGYLYLFYRDKNILINMKIYGIFKDTAIRKVTITQLTEISRVIDIV